MITKFYSQTILYNKSEIRKKNFNLVENYVIIYNYFLIKVKLTSELMLIKKLFLSEIWNLPSILVLRQHFFVSLILLVLLKQQLEILFILFFGAINLLKVVSLTRVRSKENSEMSAKFYLHLRNESLKKKKNSKKNLTYIILSKFLILTEFIR